MSGLSCVAIEAAIEAESPTLRLASFACPELASPGAKMVRELVAAEATRGDCRTDLAVGHVEAR